MPQSLRRLDPARKVIFLQLEDQETHALVGSIRVEAGPSGCLVERRDTTGRVEWQHADPTVAVPVSV